MASLKLQNIYKVYPNGTKAVNDFSMEIEDKEFIVFVGPSGCGKSTVLRMIAGLEEISAGELKIDDVVVNDVDCKDRDTAMVFQNYALYPHLTVAENMAFPIKMSKLTVEEKLDIRSRVQKQYPIKYKVNHFDSLAKKKYFYDNKLSKKHELSDLEKEEIKKIAKEIQSEYENSLNDKKVNQVINKVLYPFHYNKVKTDKMYSEVIEIAKILNMEEYLGVKPASMSGGQRQRVALGRAMVRKPKVFLLDEPLSNLDAKLRTQMRNEITKLHNRLKTTFIYVTHDQVEAMTMGDRIVVMKKGVIQQIDTPINLYSYPENIFVAGFIGTPSMNFIKAKITKNNEVVFANQKSLKIEEEQLKKFEKKYYEKDIIMGLRPEHFTISEDGVECVCLNTEMLGSETLLYCDFDLDKTNYEEGKYPFIVKTEGISHIKSGDKFKVGIDFDNVHFFDSLTEQSIMNRFVKYNEIDCVISDSKLHLDNIEISLPKVLEKLDGKYTLNIPSSSIELSNGQIKARVIESEKLKQGYQTRLLVGNTKLYALFNEEVSGDIIINIRWEDVDVRRDDEVVMSHLNLNNEVSVVLQKKKLQNKDSDLSFEVEANCKGQTISCTNSVVKRLLSASDRKIFNQEMSLVFNISSIIHDKKYKAEICEVYDYGLNQYCLCDFSGDKIILPYNKEEKEIEFSIDIDKCSIYDKSIGIRIL